jgi:hypothetical protein
MKTINTTYSNLFGILDDRNDHRDANGSIKIEYNSRSLDFERGVLVATADFCSDPYTLLDNMQNEADGWYFDTSLANVFSIFKLKI